MGKNEKLRFWQHSLDFLQVFWIFYPTNWLFYLIFIKHEKLFLIVKEKIIKILKKSSTNVLINFKIERRLSAPTLSHH